MGRFTLPRDLYHGKGSLEELKNLTGKKAIVVVGGGSMKRFGFLDLSLIHISEPTRRVVISYAVFCLKKIFFNDTATTEIYTRLFVGSVRCV